MSTPSRPGAPLRVGFAGTPEFAAAILGALLASDHRVVVVYTQPDRPAGRGRRQRPSPVKTMALGHAIEVRQPRSLGESQQQRALAASHLDVLVVAAYGLILPEAVLAIPQHGCINVHASLLPRWRGAAPVERAIMAGDTQTGVCIMQMDAGLDTGPVLARAVCPIDEETTGADLERALAELGASSLLHCLDRLETLTPEPQSETGACYARKLSPADAVIDWHQGARTIARQVRALAGRMPAAVVVGSLQIKVLEAGWQAAPEVDRTAEPGAGSLPGTIVAANRDGIRIACGEGSLILRRVQLNRGKGRPLSAADAINGYPEIFTPGARLATPA